MKKITLLLLLVTFSVFSQNTVTAKWNAELPANATTEREYNFLTKGLKDQVEKGLDMIAGYRMTPYVKNRSIDKYVFDVSLLIEEKTNFLKGISIVISGRGVANKAYLCIPMNNNDLMNQYFMSINVLPHPLPTCCSFIVSECLSKMASSSFKTTVQ